MTTNTEHGAMPELLPCPFCGSEAAFGSVDDTESSDFGGEFVACCNIACDACSMLIFPTMADAKPLLIEKWNLRKSPDQQHGQTALARVIESDDFTAEIGWLLNPCPPGTLLYEGQAAGAVPEGWRLVPVAPVTDEEVHSACIVAGFFFTAQSEKDMRRVLENFAASRAAAGADAHAYRLRHLAVIAPAAQPKDPAPGPVAVGQLCEEAFGRGQIVWFAKPANGSLLYSTPPAGAGGEVIETLAHLGPARS